jgi:hypothetical protein
MACHSDEPRLPGEEESAGPFASMLRTEGTIDTDMSRGGAARDDVELPMKVVGRRQWGKGIVATAPLLRLTLRLRGDKPFLPRGVYRFRSFEESDEWTLRMLTRPPKPGPRS